MEQAIVIICTVSCILTVSLVGSAQTGASEEANAQAIGSGSSSSESSVDDDNFVQLMRRYVPRFIGKREQDNLPIEHDQNSENPVEINVDSIEDFVDDILEYYDDLDLNDDQLLYHDKEIQEDDLESVRKETNEDITINDKQQDLAQEEKRYQPTFVGKRYFDKDDSMEEMSESEDKRYRPMFVGKRYTPRFIGKRYRPRFVGKRYQPKFIGKRYQPKFIGKRYAPRFIGKRYTPRFIGKRYAPRFIGKRYTPTFIGKRYTPKFIGKRYTPKFIGKRYTPRFVGKRYQPVFIGKKESPMLPVKKYQPVFIGKRDVSKVSGQVENSQESSLPDQTDLTVSTESHRHKRSVLSDENEMKRAWGNPPWTRFPTYLTPGDQVRHLVKRFVAPEFIGRRDSLSTILSALDALQFTRSQPRSTSKRFEAPMFVGKRRPMLPNNDYTFEMDTPTRYQEYEIVSELSDLGLEALEKIRDDVSYDLEKGLSSYSEPSNDGFLDKEMAED